MERKDSGMKNERFTPYWTWSLSSFCFFCVSSSKQNSFVGRLPSLFDTILVVDTVRFFLFSSSLKLLSPVEHPWFVTSSRPDLFRFTMTHIAGEVRRAAASFQEHPLEDEPKHRDMSETEIITIRKPDGTTETKTVVRVCVSPCPRKRKND